MAVYIIRYYELVTFAPFLRAFSELPVARGKKKVPTAKFIETLVFLYESSATLGWNGSGQNQMTPYTTNHRLNTF